MNVVVDTVENVVKEAVKEIEGIGSFVAAEEDKAKEVVVKAEEVVKAALVSIVADEKLFLREAELEYLKAQMEIQRLSKITEAKSKQYVDYIDALFVKYGLQKTEYVFDASVAQFKKL